MERLRAEEVVPEGSVPISLVSEGKTSLPPWLFRHAELTDTPDTGQEIGQEALVNTFNHIHFTEGHLLVLLRHPRYHETVLLRAHPEPCLGKRLTCRWAEEEFSGLKPEKLEFLCLIIDDGWAMILVPAALQKMEKDFFSVQIPEKGYAVGRRSARRFRCTGVQAEVNQNGFVARGELLDFSAVGFRVRVSPESSCAFHWYNADETVVIHLRRGTQFIFSGPCRCIRQQGKGSERELVLAPLRESINRYKKKEIRNIRQSLVPSPSVVFHHPFLNRRVQFKVHNISTSGFSLHEHAEERLLMPGMIIPDLTINFAGALKMQCSAQVIYGLAEENGRIRYGLAILDMDILTYSRLTHILTNALDPHAHVSNEVDMEALWEFFFSTGFMYPKKYRLIQSNRTKFKETYEKLYQGNPEIARHFTYQENGKIYGHISMVRAYQKTWMIHHHAAQSMQNKRTGFMVLKQIMHYLNDMYRFPSASTDYVMCFFRPENKFPDRVFGGFSRVLGYQGGCSMDLFSYLPHTRLSVGNQMPEGWRLEECTPFDLWELNRFYGQHSGGLLLDALGLKEKDPNGFLEKAYGGLGLLRTSKAYSLSHEGLLRAVLIVDRSDLGFNLSELLNGIKILVTDPDGLPWNTLSIAISHLTSAHDLDRVPILFYPFDYVQKTGVPFEKQYQLWVLDVQYGNEYLEYMQKRFRIGYKQLNADA